MRSPQFEASLRATTSRGSRKNLLGGERADKGLFLQETWRLHPATCAYTSELLYDGKLRSKYGLEQQVIKGAGPITESGPYFLPVVHTGDQRSCAGDPCWQPDLDRP